MNKIGTAKEGPPALAHLHDEERGMEGRGIGGERRGGEEILF